MNKLSDEEKEELAKRIAGELTKNFFESLGRGVFRKLMIILVTAILVLGLWIGIIKLPG